MWRNEAWVSVGGDHDTRAFAVALLRRWWEEMAKGRYTKARELFIATDARASNVLEMHHKVLLLRVHRHHRLGAFQELIRLRIDMLKLGVPVRARHPFSALSDRLQPIARVIQQSTHHRRTHFPARVRQRRGKLRPTLARPSQRRLRVAAGDRVNRHCRRLLDLRLTVLDARSAGSRPANSTHLRGARLQFPGPFASSRTRQSSRGPTPEHRLHTRWHVIWRSHIFDVRVQRETPRPPRTSRRWSLRAQDCVSSGELEYERCEMAIQFGPLS